MIIQIGTDVDESRILWKYKESDEWKRADIDDLIRAYEKCNTPTTDADGELISRADALMEARPEYLNPNQEKLASYNQGWNNAIEMYYRQIAELPSVEPTVEKG